MAITSDEGAKNGRAGKHESSVEVPVADRTCAACPETGSFLSGLCPACAREHAVDFADYLGTLADERDARK